MKTMRYVLICLLLASLMLTGCAGTAKKPNTAKGSSQTNINADKYPEYYAELSALIGKSKAEVLDVLNLQESEIEEQVNTGFYSTPITVELEGVSFQLVLGIVGDYFNSFNYWAVYENDPENAAKDAETIAVYIAEAMDEPDVTGETSLQAITQEKMREAFTGSESMSASAYWKLSKETTQAHKDYMEMMEKEYPALFPKGSVYALEFTVNYIVDIDTAHIKLDFGMTHDRGGNAVREN